jgi:hypothetical protein
MNISWNYKTKRFKVIYTYIQKNLLIAQVFLLRLLYKWQQLTPNTAQSQNDLILTQVFELEAQIRQLVLLVQALYSQLVVNLRFEHWVHEADH